MFQRAIISANELLYELLLWLILIPKTAIRIALSRNWVSEYIETELVKEPDKQFDDYTPPIIFFIVLAVIPFISSIPILSLIDPDSPSLRTLVEMGIENQLLVASVFVAAWPLAASLVVHRFSHKPVSRSSLRASFYSQAYLFGAAFPFFYFVFPVLFVLKSDSVQEWIKFVTMLPLIYIYWFLYQQFCLVRQQLNVSVWARLLGLQF